MSANHDIFFIFISFRSAPSAYPFLKAGWNLF